jgi:hypothetical protein
MAGGQGRPPPQRDDAAEDGRMTPAWPCRGGSSDAALSVQRMIIGRGIIRMTTPPSRLAGEGGDGRRGKGQVAGVGL